MWEYWNVVNFSFLGCDYCDRLWTKTSKSVKKKKLLFLQYIQNNVQDPMDKAKLALLRTGTDESWSASFVIVTVCFKQAAIADRCCHINLKSGVVRAVRRIVVASFPYWWIVNQPAWAKTWQKIVGKKLRSPGTRPVTASKKKKR